MRVSLCSPSLFPHLNPPHSRWSESLDASQQQLESTNAQHGSRTMGSALSPASETVQHCFGQLWGTGALQAVAIHQGAYSVLQQQCASYSWQFRATGGASASHERLRMPQLGAVHSRPQGSRPTQSLLGWGVTSISHTSCSKQQGCPIIISSFTWQSQSGVVQHA